MLYVVDTHVLIWYFVGSKRLPEKLRETIDEVRRSGGGLLVPTIVLAEALHVAETKPGVLDYLELRAKVQDDPSFEVVGFGAEILEEMQRVEDVRELHDRVIVATARFYGAGILTKDRVILGLGESQFP